jgi:hypothetical protein
MKQKTKKDPEERTMFIDRYLHRTKAFQGLSKAAITLLFEFLYRRKLKYEKEEWVVTNNARIILSYRHASKLFGFSPSTIARCLSQLVERGFIDIAHKGIASARDCSRYAISDRWKEFGTDRFIEQKRQKDTRRLGFASRKLKVVSIKNGTLKC